MVAPGSTSTLPLRGFARIVSETVYLDPAERWLYEFGRQFERNRSAMADITDSANVGVSWTKKRNRCLLSTARTVSERATAVAIRGEESTRAISPKTSSAPRTAMTRSAV